VLILGLMYVSQSILIPLLFATLISISLFPLAKLFERLRLGKAFAALLAVIVAIAIISGIIWFIVHQSIIIGKDASSITAKVLSELEYVKAWLEEKFDIQSYQVIENMRELGNKSIDNIGALVTSTFGSLRNSIANAILIPL